MPVMTLFPYLLWTASSEGPYNHVGRESDVILTGRQVVSVRFLWCFHSRFGSMHMFWKCFARCLPGMRSDPVRHGPRGT